MKALVKIFTVILTFIPTLSSLAQLPFTSPDTTDAIYLTEIIGDPNDPFSDSNKFEIRPLTPSDPDAWFMHFWWSGDNGFSFAPTPVHNHVRIPGNSPVLKMTAIPTENYGSGGPPPLTYNFTTEHEGESIRKVLNPNERLHVQSYRNAVIYDTMYLIVTYGNYSASTLPGKLKIDVGQDAEICDDIITSNRHYFPNGEVLVSNDEITYPALDSAEERSILIPVLILDSRESFIEMKVYNFFDGSSENTGQNGIDFYQISPVVANSHDPNIMIQESGAKNQCDYRGGKIHYTVKFQNDGTGTTNYIRVECHLDDKVNLDSISGIKVPRRFYQSCNKSNNLYGMIQNGSGAIWHVDPNTRILTIEMQNIKLQSSADPKLPRIDMAQGQIEFDVLVKDNYIFGTPVIAHSKIFFDSHKAIVTNVVKTGCDKPVSLMNGGGFQSDVKPIICKWIWWIFGGLLGIILLLIILLVRQKKRFHKLKK